MVHRFGKLTLPERSSSSASSSFASDLVSTRSIGATLAKSCDEEDKKNWLVLLLNIARATFKSLDCFSTSLENSRIQVPQKATVNWIEWKGSHWLARRKPTILWELCIRGRLTWAFVANRTALMLECGKTRYNSPVADTAFGAKYRTASSQTENDKDQWNHLIRLRNYNYL